MNYHHSLNLVTIVYGRYCFDQSEQNVELAGILKIHKAYEAKSAKL